MKHYASSQTPALAAEFSQSFIDLLQFEPLSLPLDQKHKVEDLATNHAPVAKTLGTATTHKDAVTTKAHELADHLIELGRALYLLLKQVEDAKANGDPRLDGIPVGAAFYYMCGRELGLSPKNAQAAMVAAAKSLETLDPYSSPKLRAASAKKRAKTNNAYLAKKAVLLEAETTQGIMTKDAVANGTAPSTSFDSATTHGAAEPLFPKLVPNQPVKPAKLVALLSALLDPAFEQRRLNNALTAADMELAWKTMCSGYYYMIKVAAGQRLKPTGYKRKKTPASPTTPSTTQQTLGF